MVWPLCKIVSLFLQRLNIALTYDAAISFLGIYPREIKTGLDKDL